MITEFSPIGYAKTPFTEKFGVPRQSLLVSAALGVIKLDANPKFSQGLRGLETFSHIWIIYVFHVNLNRSWHPLIETPRIEVRQKVGVFATRSPDRPNPIGMSVVKLEKIDWEAKNGIEIHVSGVDFLTNSPILDIKPYLLYADSIPQANSGWLKETLVTYPVIFSEESLQILAGFEKKPDLDVKTLIEQMLSLDPRPTSQRRAFRLLDPKTEALKFSFRVLELDVHWRVKDGSLFIYEIIDLRAEAKTTS